GVQQYLNGQVSEVENTVHGVAQLLPERPRALTLQPLLPLIDYILAPVANPKEECDQVAVDALQLQQMVADLASTTEDIDATGRHVADHQFSVKLPEHAGRDLGKPRVRPLAPHAEYD